VGAVPGASAAGLRRTISPGPQRTRTTEQAHNDANERDALRLVATATDVARRLRRVRADWPEEQFGALVYEAALVRLGGELAPDGAARLRREFQAHRELYLARLRETAG
jgi:hypothetical protein